MNRRALTVCLLVIPAFGLGVLGFLLVAAAPARPGAAGLGSPAHFAARQVIAILVGAALGLGAARLGKRRLFALAPLAFAAALALALAVFLPKIGVRAAGARRWVHLGPLSGSPAPFLVGATALLLAAARATGRLRLAIGAALLAVLALAAEPDFSAAAIALLAAFAALAGGGVARRRLLPAAGLLLVVLALGATRFEYVDNRIRGFMAPQRDRHGKGFEVLALAHARAAGDAAAAGLGHGTARRRLSSAASDYAFALVGEELGRAGTLAVLGAWLAIGAGVVLAARAQPGRADPAAHAAVAGLGAALAGPVALHVAVCRGWLPIIGVTMPFLSYDPALLVVSGAELGALAAIALGAGSPAA